MSRAQIALEYIIVMGIAFLVSVVFLAVIGYAHQQSIFDADQARVEQIAFDLQNELLLAAEVHDGYVREFELAYDIRGQPYTIENGSGIVSVQFRRASATRSTPTYSGSPQPGENTITKFDGVIEIS